MRRFSLILAALAATILMISPAAAYQATQPAPASHCDDSRSGTHQDNKATSAFACCVATVASVAPRITEIEPSVVAETVGHPSIGDHRTPDGYWGTDPPPPRMI